ncbi:hypothetical protein [Nonomuraea sp. LPB2021202275-12-8]|uniref:hypothetical protein n=1 Tax=Nonomuraea sp. LPB2021202275-12-8 TaxID=3120159 RepID=UPI00300CB2DD
MAFLSRLFRRSDPPAEREEARRRGMRDARRHPLNEFTDPKYQPSYVSEVRARTREQITEVDRELAARRTALLERALGARQTIMRELGRSDLRPDPHANGHATPPDADLRPPPADAGSWPAAAGEGPHAGTAAGTAPPPSSGAPEDPFISIAEARWRRSEARRQQVLEEAGETVLRARAHIEQLAQEWESALIERNHAVEALHARAEQVIAAYRSGVMRAHPRREEIPSLWKGEVIAMDSTGDSPAGVSGREEMGRILHEVEERIEVWHAEVRPMQLTTQTRRQLPPATPSPATERDTPEGDSTSREGPQAPAAEPDGTGQAPRTTPTTGTDDTGQRLQVTLTTSPDHTGRRPQTTPATGPDQSVQEARGAGHVRRDHEGGAEGRDGHQ